MRNAFADEIIKIAEEDERIVLLSGDIGNRLFDGYKAKFPNRFYNCGVAESNMASVAAGMAMCGLRPLTYTITTFNTIRCLEQIRLDICYHNVPVVIVGVGSGLSYASLGCTHHSCEDIAFLRSIPNMTIVCPADAWELRKLLRDAMQLNGPVYLRMGKKDEPCAYSEVPDVQIGKAHVLKEGKDICIIATGNIVPAALNTAALLAQKGIDAQVVSMHTVKPLDVHALTKFSEQFPLIISMEEHNLLGGLGTSIAEWMIDYEIRTSLLRFGTPDVFPHELGSQEYLRSKFGLVPEVMAKKIEIKLQSKKELCTP